MSIEQLPKNFSIGNLSGSLTSGATTLTVTNPAKFPSVPSFRVLIDSELMQVTAVAGSNFTVTRGDGGTAAAAHLTGANVTGVYTKETFDAILADIANAGSVGATYATNFSAGRAGRVFTPNDAPWLAVDDGSSVNYLGHPQYRRLYPLDSSGFSWVNQGGATESTANGIVTLTAPALANDNFRLRVKNRLASTWTLEAMVICDIYPANFNNAGLVFYDSISGKLTCFKIVNNTGVTYLNVSNITNVTTFSGDVVNLSMAAMQGIPPHWLKVQDDGTNLIFSYSVDGYTYRPAATVGRTSFLTNGCNQYGYFADPVSASFGCGVSIYSWKES